MIKISGLYRFNFKLAPSLVLVLFFILANSSTIYSQEKKSTSKMERINRGKKNRTTKRVGERAKSNKRQLRQSKMKAGSRQGDRARKGDITGRPIKTKVSRLPSPASYAKPDPYAGKKRKSEASVAKASGRKRISRPGPSGSSERTVSRSSTKGRVSARSASSAKNTIVRSSNPYAGRKKTTESSTAKKASKYKSNVRSATGSQNRGASRVAGGGKIKPKSISSQPRKVYTAPDLYAGKKNKKSPVKRPSNLANNRTVSGGGEKPGKKKRITPRTASGAFTVNKKVRPYGRKGRRGDIAYNKDITGRKFRAKKPSKMPAPAPQKFDPNYRRKLTDDKPYKGRLSAGNAFSVTRKSEKGWKGDISGRRIATNKSSPKKKITKPSYNPRAKSRSRGEQPYSGRQFGRNANSVSKSGESASKKLKSSRASLSASRPGEKASLPIGGNQRKLSISGERKAAHKPSVITNLRSATKPGEKPYTGKTVGRGNQTASRRGEVPSRQSLNGKRKLSVSGQYKGVQKMAFNPNYRKKMRGEQAYSGKATSRAHSASKPGETPSKQPLQGKRKMSVTGQFQGNNKMNFDPNYRKKRRGEQAYSGKAIGRGNLSATKPGEKAPKPQKTRKLSITGENQGNRTAQFDPYYRRKKIGDKAWEGKNFGRKNLSATKPSEKDVRKGRYIGSKSISITGQEHKNEKLPQKAQTSNGKLSASFSGNMKARKPLKSKGGSISTQWNNDGMPLQQKTRSKDTERATAYSGNLKAQKKPKGAGGSINVQWNNDGMPLQKLERSKDTGRATAYQGNMKATKPVHGGGSIDRGNWNNKGKSTNEKYISPATRIATRFTGKDKKKEIITEKRDDYVNFSGTIKVKKTKGGKDQHPSFYYVNAKNKQLNGKEEKEKKISLIVLWSKIFKRNGNQPSNLKEKPGKLEFDKREIGIWHE